MLDKSRIENLEIVDPDRYRAAVLASADDRDRLFTFYAFHAELAKIPEMVSEPMIGAIRYQWWRDALEEIYSGKPVRQHDVAKPLSMIIEDRALGRYGLDALINGRERDLDPTPFANMDDVRSYCSETSGRLLQTAVSILNPEADADLFLELGLCWGLTGLARSWRYYHSSMLANIRFEALIDETRARFNDCRAKTGTAKAEIVPAIAYTSLIPGYLKALTKPGYDPVKMTPDYGQFSKKLRLMRTVLGGKI